MKISEKRGVDFGLQVGINGKESGLGSRFAPNQSCSSFNNWGGVKYKRESNGKTMTHFTKVNFWKDFLKNTGIYCWLYPFNSINEFWDNQAWSLKVGYYDKNCKTASCIAKYYVGVPSERAGWIVAVNRFY